MKIKDEGKFKTADRLGARFIAILGEDELAQNKINVKMRKQESSVKWC